jgi:fatty acid synthase subunit alpha
MLNDIVAESFKSAIEQQRTEGYIKLERGFAMIPLPGIDVPSHSRYLWAGVMPFRVCKFLPLTSFVLIFLTCQPQ